MPKDFSEEDGYNNGFSINKFFNLGAAGIQTERDSLVIQHDASTLHGIKEDLLTLNPEEFRIKYNERSDGRDWKVTTAKADLIENNAKLIKVNYRPFDSRFTYYTGKSKGFHSYPRHNIMGHMLQENIALITERTSPTYFRSNFYISSLASECHLLGTAHSKGFTFPLYLYPTESEQSSLLDTTTAARKPNLDMAIVKKIAKAIGLKFIPDHADKKEGDTSTFSPLDLLDYIYATLHSPAYREKYKEFLKIDFPRVPYPANAGSFWQLVTLGGALRGLHLMESPLLARENLITQFKIAGTNTVDKPTFKDGRVYINPEQYFEGVPDTAWNFYIGGYQPAQKWLKDRKGRVLSFDDIMHWQKVIVALAETDRIMGEIDKVSSGT